MKLIHTADVHLDSQFNVTNPVEAEKRRTALRSAFASLILYAKSEKTQLLIISGDFFDDDMVTKDTTLALCRDMASIPQCKIVIAPGNHDPYGESSPYKLIKWPENVFIFTSDKLSYFDFPELNTRVYGYAFLSDTMLKNPLEGFTVEDRSKINFLAAHCDLSDKPSYYAPITLESLEKSGIDYACLGHIHKGSPIQKIGNTSYCYCGCLQGRDFGETGIKGAVTGEIDKEICDLRHVRFCGKKYEKTDIDVTGAKNISDCAGTITEKCSEFGSDTLLRVTLSGMTSPEFYCDENILKKLVTSPCYLEYRDETTPLLDVQKLRDDRTLAGEFYRALEEKLTSENEETRKTASNALKYGLRAISGLEIKL